MRSRADAASLTSLPPTWYAHATQSAFTHAGGRCHCVRQRLLEDAGPISITLAGASAEHGAASYAIRFHAG